MCLSKLLLYSVLSQILYSPVHSIIRSDLWSFEGLYLVETHPFPSMRNNAAGVGDGPSVSLPVSPLIPSGFDGWRIFIYGHAFSVPFYIVEYRLKYQVSGSAVERAGCFS